MSLEAMKWAMEQTIANDPSDRHVLLVLANSAREDGTAAFPAVSLIASRTGLSERTVQRRLRNLLSLGAIRLGDSAVVEAHIRRSDKRPNTYDLALERGVTVSPRKITGCHSRHSGVTLTTERGVTVSPRKITGCHSRHSGVTLTTERGVTVSPNPNITPTNPNGVCSARESGSEIRPEVEAAKAMRAHGLLVTPAHPDLIAAIHEGVTPQDLIDMASLYPDKPAGYVIAACRRQHAESAKPVTPGEHHANRHRGRKPCSVERTQDALQDFLAEYG